MSRLLGLILGNPWALLAAALVLMSMGASGGWVAATWRASNQIAEIRGERDRIKLDHAEFQRASSETIIARLQENQRLRADQEKKGREASDAYQKGLRAAENEFGPELAALRALHGAGRLRAPEGAPGAGVGGLPGADSTAGGSDPACDRRLSEIAAAVDEVVAAAEGTGLALERASKQARQLNGLIKATRPP